MFVLFNRFLATIYKHKKEENGEEVREKAFDACAPKKCGQTKVWIEES